MVNDDYTKIAVFTRNNIEFMELKLHPKSKFKNVWKLDDVRGYSFVGVICIYGWEDRNVESVSAFEYIKNRMEE